jgi:hypothetical protein
MYRVSIVFCSLFLLSLCSAQQAANSPTAPAHQASPTIGGSGNPNYIAIWQTANDLSSSVIYQSNSGNVGIGTAAPAATLDVNGSTNTALEYEIGGQSVLSYQGHGNLLVGPDAGSPSSGGAANTFVGGGAGFSNRTGMDNTFVGNGAGFSNVDASYSAFFGWAAGYNNSHGFANAFFGGLAGTYNTTGSYNSFLGSDAGENNTVGSSNTFAGDGAGFVNTTGNNNAFFGQGSGANNNGDRNSFFGNLAGYNNHVGSDNIYINNEGPAESLGESKTIRIGDPTIQSSAYVAGVYGVNTAGLPVYVNSNGQLGTQSSSLRFKDQVQDMGDSTSGLMRLRPVTFVYKPEYANGDGTTQYGLIAEEVAKIYPQLVAYDNDGKPYSVRYQYLSTMLLNEVQKQYQRAESEARVVKQQQDTINDLKERLSRLEKLVGER